MPIKTLPLAILFFAGAVAATTLLVSPVLDGSANASAKAPVAEQQELTRRGTRRPLVTNMNVDDCVGSQPRRGQRAAFETASLLTLSGAVGEGPRRGVR